jgi:superoxide dismutase, Fe-Mn family
MPIELAPLPYDRAALAPHMSAETLDFHHGKHHAGYMKKTNELIAGTPLDRASLVDIVRRAKAEGDAKLFNQSAQVWNHDFLWRSLSPQGGRGPSGELAERIENDFDGLDGFAKAFKEEAVGHFASGYAWLVLDGDRLAVTSFHDADTPLVRDGLTPLLTLDLWEHAYYLDWRNARPDFVDAFLAYLVNWDFAAENLARRGTARAQAA